MAILKIITNNIHINHSLQSHFTISIKLSRTHWTNTQMVAVSPY